MKYLGIIFGVLMTYSASAKEVEVTCATKAFTCTNGVCGWVQTTVASATSIQAFRDPNYPKDGAPFELWRATHQMSYDNHLLTLAVEVKDYGTRKPVSVFARLGAGSVFAEATASNKIEIGLRNHTYGRGFSCTSIRAID